MNSLPLSEALCKYIQDIPEETSAGESEFMNICHLIRGISITEGHNKVIDALREFLNEKSLCPEHLKRIVDQTISSLLEKKRHVEHLKAAQDHAEKSTPDNLLPMTPSEKIHRSLDQPDPFANVVIHTQDDQQCYPYKPIEITPSKDIHLTNTTSKSPPPMTDPSAYL